MKKTDNMVWRFFASVRLALFSLLILATTSIIGTLIPQKNPADFYIEAFGQRTAQFFQMLDVPDMYNSWWFLALLLLFSINLVVCTIDRLPNVWQMVVLNNLDTEPERLEKMPHRHLFYGAGDGAALAETTTALLAKNGWKSQSDNKPTGILLFSQKNAWSRLGVYAVHLSILIIFAGAIIGSLLGFKAGVMIPEGSTTDTVYETGTGKPIPLGFTLQCDDFNVTFYADGTTPKEFRSDLSVLENGKLAIDKRPIIVNDPLDYKGITFYQSSYEPMQGFNVLITNKNTKVSQFFQIPFGQKISWSEGGIDFGVINQEVRSRMGDVQKLKVWFSDGTGEPSIFWMDNDTTQAITTPTGTYEFQANQVYATGLQVAKDPGVWTVYAGCALMLIGLYVAFFLSHRRVWVYIVREETANRCRILVCGSSNKNKLAFENEFTALVESFTHDTTFQNA
ncbi:cytochrome c biogenesis protein ResB [Thiovibrio frasassiensis]|uniref:Cytochrome c biogenesis protein ResB n=1 Tax=Thiovibrio frasassiensis TaxID=2984131 RepID=A0A9X4MI06_9BACT|nr:cytochrome c biogenesis protein ResB [Thiovibrio frasassiensis]MDG4476230.1 cytochrome c biogenesis protein ResB [Thiovibrio frasassiensis]